MLTSTRTRTRADPFYRWYEMSEDEFMKVKDLATPLSPSHLTAPPGRIRHSLR